MNHVGLIEMIKEKLDHAKEVPEDADSMFITIAMMLASEGYVDPNYEDAHNERAAKSSWLPMAKKR